MSRAELARILGLNRSTTGSIVRNLQSAGLVVASNAKHRPQIESRAGRPGVLVELDGGGAWFLGAEIEADHLTVVALDLAARCCMRRSIGLLADRFAPEAMIDRLGELVGEVERSLPGSERIQGLCVTIPALLDRSGRVLNAPVLQWRDVLLVRLLEARLGRRYPVLIENDANAFAVAETYLARTVRPETVVFLFIESGVGGGIVQDGRLFRGQHGVAGEFGHLVVGSGGFVDAERRPGHLENYASKAAILARYREVEPRAYGLEVLAAAHARGDASARAVVDEWASRLVRGLVLIVTAFNPGRIVIGGSIAGIVEAAKARILGELGDRLIDGVPLPTLEVSTLGEDGPAIGGACIVHQSMFAPDAATVHGLNPPRLHEPAIARADHEPYEPA